MSRYIVSATDEIHFATGQRVVTPIHKSNDSTTQLVQVPFYLSRLVNILEDPFGYITWPGRQNPGTLMRS